jgi:hypothetical protein
MGDDLLGIAREAGDRPAWLLHACRELRAERIADHDQWNGRLALDDRCCWGAGREDRFDVEPHQIGNEARNSLEVALGESTFYGECLALGQAERCQSFPKRVQEYIRTLRSWARAGAKEADSRDLRGRVRVRASWKKDG